jgi:hypothetical protein
LIEIDENGKSLDEKLDAYHLLISVLHHQQENEDLSIGELCNGYDHLYKILLLQERYILMLASNTCCKVLKLLGEEVPITGKMSAVLQIWDMAKTRIFTAFTSDEIFSLPHTKCKRDEDIMRFYWKLMVVSYHRGNDYYATILCGYYVNRWLSFCLNRKAICRYTPVSLVFYSALILSVFDTRNINEAHRLGNVALRCLHDSGSQAELPGT